MIAFAHPERLLLAALAVALFAFVYRAFERRAARQAYEYSSLAFAADALRARAWPSRVFGTVLALGVAALACAVAGPRLTLRVPAKNATVMLCIDTSGSMRATDLLPTRSDASKSAALAFLAGVPEGTRVGIVSFASEAVLVQPPTDDLDAVRAALSRVPGPNGATAIGEALALAARSLPAQGTRAIVLLTDGVNNRGVDPVSAARQAAASGITIHTVGVGTNGSGQLIPGTDEPADLDEDTLRAVASLGHGTYASARDSGALAAAFGEVARETVWERRSIDAAALFAAGGGTAVVLTFLAGLAAGKYF